MILLISYYSYFLLCVRFFFVFFVCFLLCPFFALLVLILLLLIKNTSYDAFFLLKETITNLFNIFYRFKPCPPALARFASTGLNTFPAWLAPHSGLFNQFNAKIRSQITFICNQAYIKHRLHRFLKIILLCPHMSATLR